METETGQATHVVGESQQGLISGEADPPVQVDVKAPSDQTVPESKQRGLIIGIIAAIVIVIVVIVLVIAIDATDDLDTDSECSGEDCCSGGCWFVNDTFDWRWDQVCGMLNFSVYTNVQLQHLCIYMIK